MNLNKKEETCIVKNNRERSSPIPTYRESLYPLHGVVIDCIQLDCYISDSKKSYIAGRPWLTLAINLLDLDILNMNISLDLPKANTVRELLNKDTFLKQVKKSYDSRDGGRVNDKQYEIVLFDRKVFKSMDIEEIIDTLNIQIRYIPKWNYTYRGVIEGVFRTIHTHLNASGRNSLTKNGRSNLYTYDELMEVILQCIESQIKIE